jgi:hypothetical protein
MTCLKPTSSRNKTVQLSKTNRRTSFFPDDLTAPCYAFRSGRRIFVSIPPPNPPLLNIVQIVHQKMPAIPPIPSIPLSKIPVGIFTRCTFTVRNLSRSPKTRPSALRLRKCLIFPIFSSNQQNTREQFQRDFILMELLCFLSPLLFKLPPGNSRKARLSFPDLRKSLIFPIFSSNQRNTREQFQRDFVLTELLCFLSPLLFKLPPGNSRKARLSFPDLRKSLIFPVFSSNESATHEANRTGSRLRRLVTTHLRAATDPRRLFPIGGASYTSPPTSTRYARAPFPKLLRSLSSLLFKPHPLGRRRDLSFGVPRSCC